MEFRTIPSDFVGRSYDLVTFLTIIITDLRMCALRTCRTEYEILRKVLLEIVRFRTGITEITVNTVFYGLSGQY